MQRSAALLFVGIAASQLVEQNQDDDADPDHEDREHDNQLLAVHTFLPPYKLYEMKPKTRNATKET